MKDAYDLYDKCYNKMILNTPENELEILKI